MNSLQEQLAEYENTIKSLTNIKAKQQDVSQIATMISAIPMKKWNAANAVVNGTIAYKDAQANLRAVKARLRLEANRKEDLKASDDRKAYVEQHQDTLNAETAMLNAQAELKSAELGYECLDDLFTAGKKIMDYLTDQARAERNFERFDNEARSNNIKN